MKRTFLVILVSAVAGVVITTFVGWGSLYLGSSSEPVLPPKAVDRFPPDWDPGPRLELRYQRFGVRLASIRMEPDNWAYRFQVGWPFQALFMQHQLLPPEIGFMDLGGIPAAFTPDPPRHNIAALAHDRLPIRPVWPGMALNVMLYGGIVYLLFVIPGALSRRHRWRRGACLRCRYDLRGSGLSVCPECGEDRRA